MEYLITVFTPTYNRAYTLGRLYQSLLRQTDKRFVWLIMDDGSTDDTETLVLDWKTERKIRIDYFKQVNRGRSSAYNKACELTKTPLFMGVDSDDYLMDDAIQSILHAWNKCSEGCVGFLGLKSRADGSPLANVEPDCPQLAPILSLSRKMQGEISLIFVTSVFKKYRYPEFEGEKFVMDGYVCYQANREGNFERLDKVIQICEYFPDGYSVCFPKLLYNNPNGYFAFLDLALRTETNFFENYMNSARYLALGFAYKKSGLIKNAVYPGIAVLAYPAGIAIYLKRRIQGIVPISR